MPRLPAPHFALPSYPLRELVRKLSWIDIMRWRIPLTVAAINLAMLTFASGGIIDMTMELEVVDIVQKTPPVPIPVRVGDSVSLQFTLTEGGKLFRRGEPMAWETGDHSWISWEDNSVVKYLYYEDFSLQGRKDWLVIHAGAAVDYVTDVIWSDLILFFPSNELLENMPINAIAPDMLIRPELQRVPFNTWTWNYADPFFYDRLPGPKILFDWARDRRTAVFPNILQIDDVKFRGSDSESTAINAAIRAPGAHLWPRKFTSKHYVAGDANKDDVFDQQDVVQILQRGMYGLELWQIPRVLSSGWWPQWADGDFDGDSVVDQHDLVLALQEGAYGVSGLETSTVPEPSALLLVASGLSFLLFASNTALRISCGPRPARRVRARFLRDWDGAEK